jgi:hypothetical protein
MDLRADLLKEASNHGDLDTHVTELFRRIPVRCRQIIPSSEYAASIAQNPELKQLAEEFEKQIRRGEDLNPRRSKYHKRPGFKDALLNDFGIHHLRLQEPDLPPYYRLYAIIIPAEAYLLDARVHPEKGEFGYEYGLEDLVNISHDNWPDRFFIVREGKLLIPNGFFPDHFGREEIRSWIRQTKLNSFIPLSENTFAYPKLTGD